MPSFSLHFNVSKSSKKKFPTSVHLDLLLINAISSNFKILISFSTDVNAAAYSGMALHHLIQEH